MPASHHVLEFIRRDLAALRRTKSLAAVQHREPVSNGKRMADVMGDENNRDVLFAHVVDGCKDICRLTDTKR